MLLVKRWEAECLGEGWAFSEHATNYMVFCGKPCNCLATGLWGLVQIQLKLVELYWLQWLTGLVDGAASLRSGGFNLLCFKVSAPGISLFNLQLRAISEEIPEEAEKQKNTTTWTDQNNQMDCVVEMGYDWQLLRGGGQPAVTLSQQGLLCWGIGSKYCWD